MVDNLFVNWFLLRVTPTPTIQERHLKVSTHLPIPGQSHVMTISCPPLPFPFSLLRSWKKIKISLWQLPLASALPIAAFARGPQGQIPIGSLLRLDFIWSFCSFMCSVECADVEEEKDEVFSPKFLKFFLIFTMYVHRTTMHFLSGRVCSICESFKTSSKWIKGALIFTFQRIQFISFHYSVPRPKFSPRTPTT